MPEFRPLKAAEARRVPWKNGRGVTEEIAISPVGATFEAGDFDWRVSKSKVEAAGAFSTFAGFDRVLVVVDGEGLVLDHGGAAPRAGIGRLAPYAFSGDWTTTAEPKGGPVADFNVIVRRGARRAEVVVARVGPKPGKLALGAGDALLHVVTGPILLRYGGDGRMFAIVPGDGLLVRGAAVGDELAASCPHDEGVALLVRIASV